MFEELRACCYIRPIVLQYPPKYGQGLPPQPRQSCIHFLFKIKARRCHNSCSILWKISNMAETIVMFASIWFNISSFYLSSAGHWWRVLKLDHFHKCWESQHVWKGFISLTGDDRLDFPFLQTITLVLLCQPKTITPWTVKSVQWYFQITWVKHINAHCYLLLATKKERKTKQKWITIIKGHTPFKNVPKPNCCPETSWKEKLGKVYSSSYI